MTKDQVISRLEGHTDDLRERFRVRELTLFGSVCRGEASEDSDVDLLVTLEGRAEFDLFMDLRFHLESLLGVKVDLVTDKGLRPRLRSQIMREAIRVA